VVTVSGGKIAATARRAGEAWSGYWFGPVAAARPYLLAKVVFVMLAFDAWLLRVPAGARYGAGAFGVAHFGWLDALQPLPWPGLYVGLMLAVGVLALVCALANAGRGARLLLAALWTYGWCMSLADSFQHHYFLSLLLVLLALTPPLDARNALPEARPRRARRHARRDGPPAPTLPMTSCWPYALIVATIAIVYVFTALTKVDVEWRAGRVLDHLARPHLGVFRPWVEGLGVGEPALWRILTAGVVLTEALLALGYALAPRLDARGSGTRTVAWGAFAAALALHLTAELILKLRIGWFSAYMIAIACVCLLPGALLVRVAALVARLLDVVAETTPFTGPRGAAAIPAKGVVLLGVAAIGTPLAAGVWLGLPGARALGVILAALGIGAAGVALLTPHRRRAAQYLAAGSAAVLVMWVSVVGARTRRDFYLEMGYDLRARGDLRGARQAFDAALRYHGGRVILGRPPGPLPPRRAPDPGLE
jgi:hypothetical protein